MSRKRYTTPRTKELGIRIAAFLSKLEAIECDKRIKTSKGYETAVRRVAEAETAYWRDFLGLETAKDSDGLAQRVHGSVHTLSSYFTDYRNAIGDAYEGRMDDRNSYQVEQGLSSNRRLVRYPIARKFFVKTSIESQIASEQVRDSVFKTAGNVQVVSRSAILSAAQKLLQGNSYIGIAIGLIAVTGRRPVEILKTGTFTKTGDYSVIFSGQLKTKGSEISRDNYEIPTLIPADEVIDALAKLRDKKDFSGVDNRQVEMRVATQIQDKMEDVFFGLWTKPNAKDLRAIYAQINWERYEQSAVGQRVLDKQTKRFSLLLGHAEKDVKTAESYIRFRTIA